MLGAISKIEAYEPPASTPRLPAQNQFIPELLLMAASSVDPVTLAA